MKKARLLILSSFLLASCAPIEVPSSSEKPTSHDSEQSQSSTSQSSESRSSTSTESSTSSISIDPLDPEYVDPAKWTLWWHDEFDGSSLNEDYWSYQIGDGSPSNPGWGNGEEQYYRQENVTVGDGVLTITAKKEDYGGKSYTSSRIRTYKKVSTTYGRIEAKIKLPNVQGCWPAFWMLPESDYEGRGWPYSGEIDIMENKGRQARTTSGALHYYDKNEGHHYNSNEIILDSRIDEWHIYAIEWSETEIRWLADGEQFLIQYPEYWHPTGGAYSSNDTAPFNRDFHILLNMAIGGHFDNWRKPPDNMLPAQMQVDYVRIYRAK